jgi:hypothetical protein
MSNDFNLFSLIIGIIAGYLFHALTIKINFKQWLLSDKKELYENIINKWMEVRNIVYDIRTGKIDQLQNKLKNFPCPSNQLIINFKRW